MGSEKSKRTTFILINVGSIKDDLKWTYDMMSCLTQVHVVCAWVLDLYYGVHGFDSFTGESKEKEAKNIDKEIALEKKVKEMDNIVCKMGQSAQIKAHQIRLMLYDGSVIAKETNVISIADSKETLMLEEESRSKMLLRKNIINIVVNSSVDMNTSVNVNSSVAMNDSVHYVENCNKCLELEAELIKQHNMNNTSVNQTEPTFDHLFELNNLKAQLQAKDTPIEKLKANIKRLNKTSTTNSVKKDLDEIVTINIELEHRMAKLIAENEHLKQTYKQLYDSIKPSHVRVKEHVESLVNQLNQKKVKGKDIVDNAAQVSNATTTAPGRYKLDPVTLASKDKNNRKTHIYYLKHTMEQADILREIVEQAKSLNPLDSASYSAYKYVKLIQELLGYVRDTFPDIHKPSEKLVAVMTINKKKTVRFAEPVISSSTSQKQLGSSQTQVKQTTNNSVLTSTGVSRSTKSSSSKSTDNTKNDRILQISSSTQKKNKVEDHSRIVKSCLNKPNCVVEPSGNANVQHSKLNTNSELMCVKCNSSMFDARHELCFLEFVSDMNVSSKSKSVTKAKKKEEWKPTGKVFTKIGYNWRPTGRTFTLVGNACPLTRITATNKVPFRELIPLEVVAQESVITKVYTRIPKVHKTDGSNSKPKIAKSMISNKTELGTSRGSNTSVDPSSSSLADLRSMGKIKKQSHKPKSKDTNQVKLYLLHMDLCGPMRLASINGKKYILVIVDDYSQLTWVKFLASKDEAPDFIIKFLKMIQVRLNATVRNIRIDNGTEFVNQTIRSYYENVTLCYPNSDSEDLGKLQAKADIGIFIGYAPKKKAYHIYNRRTQKIIETIHVDFDELTAMASEQLGSGPGLQSMTPSTSCSGLVTNPIPQQPCNPPKRDDWDHLFQPMFDEYFNPPTITVSPVLVAATPIAVDLANSPVSTLIDQDAPSTSIPSTQEQVHSLIISQGFEESLKTPHFHDDPLHESLHEDSTSQGSSSNVRPIHTPFK
ncbi:retrovirus-related pol polyprotein from transposon TNT 1-94 [Tanacetum coccineum]